MSILRQALQDEQSGQRRATDDPRPAYRQRLPQDVFSSPAGCREQSGHDVLAGGLSIEAPSEHVWLLQRAAR